MAPPPLPVGAEDAAASTNGRIFIVQRGTAFYQSFEDRFIEIVGVFASLKDANAAVRLCKKEFMAEFGIAEPESAEADDNTGFRIEDRGDEYHGTPSLTGTSVGLYWELDNGTGWYTCGVECYGVIPPLEGNKES